MCRVYRLAYYFLHAMRGITSTRMGHLALATGVIVALGLTHAGGPWLRTLPLIVLIAAWAVGIGVHRRWPPAGAPLPVTCWMLLGSLSLYLASSAGADPLFAWPKWGEAMVIRWAGLALVLAAVLRWKPQWTPRLVPWATIACLAWAVASFWTGTGGAPLYNDDHPSFILRLSILAESLPRWIPYNPYWNGGGATTYEAASGSLGPAVLLWPLLKLFPAPEVYTPGIALLFLGLVPLVAGISVRMAGGGATAGWTAALLATCPGWMLFRWLLEFGAIGSCLAMSFLLPVSALLCRLLDGTRFGYGHAAALVACSLGYLAWPGSWPMASVLAIAVLMTVRGWQRATTLKILGCGALVLILIAPLMVSLLTRTDLARFAADGSLEAQAVHWTDGFHILGASFRETNPLLLWLGVVGGVAMMGSRQRLFVGTLLAGLVLLTGWGEQVGGGPGLSRAGLALAFVAILPASLAVERSASRPVVFAALVALLVVSGYSSARFFGNRTTASYRTPAPDVIQLADWLREHTPDQGRVLFGGMAVHAYGGGHVAALPLLAEREMLAADYYHFSPRLVEYFSPPREFRENDADVHRYLMLYGVHHVVAYDEPSVIRFYRKYPDLYEEVKTVEGPLPKVIFRVRAATNGLFHANQGTVRAGVNQLQVRIDDPNQDSVIAYHHVPGLVAESPAELFPVERDGRTWIGIRAHGAPTVTIRYRGWL